MKWLRGSIVLAASLLYLNHVFGLSYAGVWRYGLGDWQDPYFINALLEHWYRSATRFTDPSSPPIFFPARGTLGYSHGLVLYALFYVPFRSFLDPFPAHTLTLVAVMAMGILSLYVLARKLGLSFVESLLTTALFATSANVVHQHTATWSQRASVFLVPPILLVLVQSLRFRTVGTRLAVAFLGGLLSTLMYVQDFYTAHLATLFAASLAIAVAIIEPGARRAVAASFRSQAWPWVVCLGALAGAAVFLWIYLPAYQEHRAFPPQQLVDALVVRRPAGWRGVLDVARDLATYSSHRSFVVVFVAGALAWVPWFRADRKGRAHATWFVGLSLVVLLVPLRLPEFSIWKAAFAWLPGFGVIRDPKRIIFIYELAVALALAWFGGRLPGRSPLRILLAALVLAVLAGDWNRETFQYARSVPIYKRWAGAPVAVDPACKCFYITGASADYMSRSGHMWSLYGVEAMFVALAHGLPTLNGYSAWVPDGWDLNDPQEPGYPERVGRWVERHGLHGVCEFDIEARTMRLRR